MNIDSSLGMALFSNDISAAGNLNGLGNGQVHSQEGSLFQKLISQMMASKSQTAGIPGLDAGSGEQSQTSEPGNLLTELLLAGGNLTKIRFENGDAETGESMNADGQIIEMESQGQNGGGMEALQTFMAGIGNPVLTDSIETASPETQTVSAAEAVVTATVSAQTAAGNHLDVSANREYIPDNAASKGGPTGTSALTNETAAAQADISVAVNGTTVLNEGNTAQQTDETARIKATAISSSEKPAPIGNGSLNAMRAEPTSVKSEKQASVSEQDFKASQQVSNQQTTAAGSQRKESTAEFLGSEDSVGVAEKAKPEMDPKETGLERNLFQNSIQGAVAAREAAETVPQGQAVETSQPFSQIKDVILTKLEQNGPTEFKMQLDPEDLGQIDIKLKLSEGKLIIDILAANSKTQALLSGQVDKLIASMGLQNVTVESVQVNQQMNSQTQDNSQSQGYSMNAAMDFSQRKQQEQHQQQFLNDSKLAGTFSRQPDEIQSSNQTSRIESMRFNSHRMNYAV